MSFLTPMLPALTAGAGLMSAYGQFTAGQEAAKASDLNAQNYERQSALTRKSAQIGVETGERQKEAIMSSNKAIYAFRGVKMSGSPLLVMADTAANLEQDIKMTEYNTLIGASQAESAAATERMRARIYRTQSYVEPAKTLINTAVKMDNFNVSKPSVKKEEY